MTTKNQLRTLLVSVPFISCYRPPAAIGILKGVLTAKDYPTLSTYLAPRLANALGRELYENIAFWRWVGDGIYSLCLFPSKKRREIVEDIYWQTVKRENVKDAPSFDFVMDAVAKFNDEIASLIKNEKFDVIGFSILGNQTLASLYFAKIAKKYHPKSKVVFGGAMCAEKLGLSLLQAFPWIDYVVDGEGEETLVEILTSLEQGHSKPIDGCSYRIGNKICRGPERPAVMNLDALPAPDYSEYFSEVKKLKGSVKANSIPFEMVRGCWWNRCSFCALRGHTRKYRAFSPQHIVHMIKTLSKRHRLYDFVTVDYVQYAPLEKIIKPLLSLGNKMTYFFELRASISEEEARALQDIGVVNAQFGIESLSSSLLKKMNKGTTALQNIQALKFSKDKFKAIFNLIIGYPGETVEEFNETLRMIKACWHLVHSHSESTFQLQYLSPMAMAPRTFGLRNVKPHGHYSWLYPERYLKRMTAFHELIYKTPLPRQGSYQQALKDEGWPGSHNPSLYYVDRGNSLVIEDARLSGDIVSYTLESPLRKLYLYCSCIRSRNEICAQYARVMSKNDIKDYLDELCEADLMVREQDSYLSLAVEGRYSNTVRAKKKRS